jgi:hypothetical protein
MGFILKKISVIEPTTTTTTTTLPPTTTEGPYNPTIELVLSSSGETSTSAFKEFDVVFTPSIPSGSTVKVDFEGYVKVDDWGIPIGSATGTSYVKIMKNGSTYYEALASRNSITNGSQTITFTTAANAFGGSPQVTNGDTLSFRQEVTAELGGTGTARGEGELISPSATVTPLGTPTIIPSIPIQEVNQYINKTVTI